LLDQFSRVLVTSEADREGLLKIPSKDAHPPGGDRDDVRNHVKVLPNGVDLDYFFPSTEKREPATLVFTGKMSYHANVAAVDRFVKEVMPRIWARRPEVRLWIVGKDPSRKVRELGRPWTAEGTNGAGPGKGDPRIQITGTVDDIRPFLHKATLAVAPIQYGAGIQNKVLEALSCGTPVVTTPKAVMGLAARQGEDLVVAESGQPLAEAIVWLLNHPRKQRSLQVAGRQFVETHHHWAAIAGRLGSIYEEAGCETAELKYAHQ
jgi:polysaccharide biosynthesis protein PslH